MLTANTQFERELKKRIADEQARIKEILATGAAIKDHSDYLKYVGQHQALVNVAGEYCDDVNKIISER